jgi:type IV pilus assembly protein PilO
MNKMRQWSVLTAVGCLAVLVLGWFALVSPQRTHAKQYRAQAAGVEASNATLQSDINQLRQQQKGQLAQQRELAAIARQIPDNPALPALIRQLSAAAKGAGVDLVSLAPGNPVAVSSTSSASHTLSQSAAARNAATSATGGTASTAAATPAHAAASSLTEIPVTVQVQGSYYNIEQFFAAVENMTRSVLNTAFTIGGANANNGGTSVSSNPNAALPPGTLTAQITAVVFMSPPSVASTSPVALAPAAK